MKFIKTHLNEEKNHHFLKLSFNEEEQKILDAKNKEEWVFCFKEIYDYALNLKEGDPVSAVIIKKENKYFIEGPIKKIESTDTASGLIIPSATETTTKKNYYSKSPEEQEQIKRLSCASTSANCLQVLVGQVSDIETVASLWEVIYDKIYNKISEK